MGRGARGLWWARGGWLFAVEGVESMKGLGVDVSREGR